MNRKLHRPIVQRAMLADHLRIPFPVPNYRRSLKDAPINRARDRAVPRLHLPILNQRAPMAPNLFRKSRAVLRRQTSADRIDC